MESCLNQIAMTKHFNITITGKVQGVFFRAGAEAEALKMGVSGFTRNEPNGDVYIEAEGNPDPLAHFLEWCNKGPEKAKVIRVLVEDAEVTGFTSFEIRR
jgi:acylphosphatase